MEEATIVTQEMALGLLFAAFGALILVAMLMDWDWIFRMRRMGFLVGILTRTGVRILYSLIALVMIICGVLVAMGVIEPPKK